MNELEAQCRAALLMACRNSPRGANDWIDADDAAAALARAILALSSGCSGGAPCSVCTDRALAAVRQAAP